MICKWCCSGSIFSVFLGIVDLCGLFCRHTTSRSSEVKQEITSNHLARVRYVWFIFIVVCLLILWLLCDSRVTFMCFLCDFYVTLLWASCDFPLITFLYEYLCRITQSWAPQAKVLGSSILKDYILCSWFLLELSAQNLVLDLKYAKWTWPHHKPCQ